MPLLSIKDTGWKVENLPSYKSESDVKGAVNKLNLPVLHNPCPANKHTQREYVNELVKRLTKEVPYARERMLGAIYHPERANLWQKPDKSDD